MMPNTSVSPAASRNSSKPNCNPLTSCSTTTSMDPQNPEKQRYCLSMISAQTLRVCREGKPLHTFPDHALKKQRQRLGTAAYCCWAHHLTQDCLTPRTIIRLENPSLLHRALVVEAILVVLDDGGHRFQRELALGVLDHVLQVEILDRDVVLAVFVGAAHRLEVGLLHLGLHRVLLGHVALDRNHSAVDQAGGIIGLRAVEARAQARVLLAIVGN